MENISKKIIYEKQKFVASRLHDNDMILLSLPEHYLQAIVKD